MLRLFLCACGQSHWPSLEIFAAVMRGENGNTRLQQRDVAAGSMVGGCLQGSDSSSNSTSSTSSSDSPPALPTTAVPKFLELRRPPLRSLDFHIQDSSPKLQAIPQLSPKVVAKPKEEPQRPLDARGGVLCNRTRALPKSAKFGILVKSKPGSVAHSGLNLNPRPKQQNN